MGAAVHFPRIGRTVWVTGCVAGSVAVVLAGCSSSASSSGSIHGAAKEPGAAQLQSSARNSVRQAGSVHVDGRLTDNGTPVTIDLNATRNGGLSGTIAENGAPFQVISTNGKVYVKATQAFLNQAKAPAGTCAVVCGKWIELPKQQADQLTGNLSMSNLTGELQQEPDLHESGTTTVHGQPAYVLTGSQGTTVDVSTAPAHYRLEVRTGGGSQQQVIDYSRWNSAPAPAAPPASEILNFSQLK
jgi:polyisoprenoid-binding protein YceI